MKRFYFTFLLVALLFFTACQNDKTPENMVAFGEAYTASVGSMFHVANLYEVEITDLFVNYDGEIYVKMKVKGQDASDIVSVYRAKDSFHTSHTEEGCIVTPYTIDVVDFTETTATLVFRERIFSQPMVLSGNPEDVYTFDDYQYVVGDRAVLYFGKGTRVTGDALILVEKVMKELEEKTGIKFQNASFYGTRGFSSVRDNLFGYDPWNGYDYYSKDHVSLYFFHDTTERDLISHCVGKEIALVDEDYDFHEHSLNTLAHELTHGLFAANYEQLYLVLTEGLGTYWGRQISMKYPQYINGTNAISGPDYENTWWYEGLTSENAEEAFNTEFSRDNNSGYYNLGYELITYLYENYSLEEVNRFFTKLSEGIWQHRLDVDEYAQKLIEEGCMLGYASSQEYETRFLKEYWGTDFFRIFGTWACENEKRFSTLSFIPGAIKTSYQYGEEIAPEAYGIFRVEQKYDVRMNGGMKTYDGGYAVEIMVSDGETIYRHSVKRDENGNTYMGTYEEKEPPYDIILKEADENTLVLIFREKNK